jgi:phenolic acid decarboxylase
MDRQHTENLFRRYKGQLVNIKSISGGVYKGHVGEITSNYVSLSDRGSEDEIQTFLFFDAIESLVVSEVRTVPYSLDPQLAK